MTRFRLTMSTEWDADPAHYSEDEHEMTVVEMLAIDQKNAEDDPWGMLNCGDTKVKVVVEEITTPPSPTNAMSAKSQFIRAIVL